MARHHLDEHFRPTSGLELESYIASGDLEGAHHLLRYLWARRCLADIPGISSLLDLGAGAGYGADLLAANMPRTHVTAADYDSDAIAEARAAYTRPNLEFVVGDAMRWTDTLGDRLFDA